MKPEQNPKLLFYFSLFFFFFILFLFLFLPFSLHFLLPPFLSSPPTTFLSLSFRHCSDHFRPTPCASHLAGPPSALSALDPRPGAQTQRSSPHVRRYCQATPSSHELALLRQASPPAAPARPETLKRAPGATQVLSRHTVGHHLAASWIGPLTSLGPPRTSPNQSRTNSYASDQISSKPPPFVAAAFGQRLFRFKLPPGRR